MTIRNYIKIVEELYENQRLDKSCWKGYKKSGVKIKGGVKVNNCVPEGASVTIDKDGPSKADIAALCRKLVLSHFEFV